VTQVRSPRARWHFSSRTHHPSPLKPTPCIRSLANYLGAVTLAVSEIGASAQLASLITRHPVKGFQSGEDADSQATAYPCSSHKGAFRHRVDGRSDYLRRGLA
jgi:hypothetical protein